MATMKKGSFKMVSKRAEGDLTCFYLDCRIPKGQWYWRDILHPNVEASRTQLCDRCFEMIVGRGGIHPDDIVES